VPCLTSTAAVPVTGRIAHQLKDLHVARQFRPGRQCKGW
jgi:hypothetical protein